jgi:hypothetical protein
MSHASERLQTAAQIIGPVPRADGDCHAGHGSGYILIGWTGKDHTKPKFPKRLPGVSQDRAAQLAAGDLHTVNIQVQPLYWSPLDPHQYHKAMVSIQAGNSFWNMFHVDIKYFGWHILFFLAWISSGRLGKVLSGITCFTR